MSGEGDGEGGGEREYEKDWLLEINGVGCNIYVDEDGQQGHLIERHMENGREATVLFICPWAQRLDLVAGLVGTVDYNGETIERTPPFAYPLSEYDENAGVMPKRLVCTSISDVRGIKWQADADGSVTGTPGWGGFVFALLTAEFTTPPYLIEQTPGGDSFNDLLGQTYCISKTRTSGEVFSPPTGSYVYAEGTYKGKPLDDVGASRIRCRTEISATRVRMPIMPDETIGSLIGSVNSAPFTVEGTEYPAGSVLFTGANPEPRSDPYSGGLVQDVELTFLANSPDPESKEPLDFNFFLDPSGAWVKVTTASGDPVFPYDDLGLLFQDTIS